MINNLNKLSENSDNVANEQFTNENEQYKNDNVEMRFTPVVRKNYYSLPIWLSNWWWSSSSTSSEHEKTE